MATTSITVAATPLVSYILDRADDALILGHRLSEWCGHAPIMEEDLALANMGLDLIGQARALYTYGAEVEANGHDEDDFAYLREQGQYGNLLLVEQPNGDFAQTMVRQVFYSAFIDLYWRALMQSGDAMLAAIAAKAEKESAYHLRHSSEWLIRLGDGSEESHLRAQAAVENLWAFTGEMFGVSADERALIADGIAVDPATVREEWDKTIDAVFEQATLTRPENSWMQKGGRSGRHSEHLGHILTDLQYIQRSYPGAKW